MQTLVLIIIIIIMNNICRRLSTRTDRDSDDEPIRLARQSGVADVRTIADDLYAYNL